MACVDIASMRGTYRVSLQSENRGVAQKRLVQNLQPIDPDEDGKNVPVDGLSDTSVL